MPKYEYKCEECAETFEENQSLDDPVIEECPFCKGHVYRVIGTPGVIFNGQDFTQSNLI